MVQHARHTVNILAVIHAVQLAGVIAKEHGFVKMHAFIAEQADVKQLVPAQQPVKAAGFKGIQQQLHGHVPPGNVDVDPGPRHGLFLFVHRVGIAGGNAHIIFADGIQKCFVEIRIHQVVRIHKADVIPAGIVQPNVQSGGRAAVFLVEHPDARVGFGKLSTQLAAAVGAAILHQQQLKVRKALGQNAAHRAGDVILGVIYSCHNGNGRVRHAKRSSHKKRFFSWV